VSFEVLINGERCKGCGLCIALCPAAILAEADSLNAAGIRPVAVLRMDDCRGCRQCAIICPEAAIALYRVPTTPRTATASRQPARAARPAKKGKRKPQERASRG
jgi:2-oxoglutarate ferredoxin oxidoreductase subunit delta